MKHGLVLLVIILMACGAAQKTSQQTGDSELLRLQEYMTGTFDSHEQSTNHSGYYDITLHMYPIWVDRTDGPWMYIEQTVSENPGRPYRQRVYQLIQRKHDYESRVYELPNPEKSIGAWKGGTHVDDIGPDELILRDGCSVFLRYLTDQDVFKGRTTSGACMSTLRGAQFAESEVVISATTVESWDRGFDANGQQVWGAVDGPYIFKRSTDFPD